MADHLLNSESNIRRQQDIENAFGCMGIPLVEPGRVLIGEGTLMKVCRKSTKPRKFFLFNDLLIYASILVDGKRYIRQRVLPLDQLTVEPMADSEKYQNCLIIRTIHKSFVVRAGTRNVKRQWLLHLRVCIDNVLRKSGKEAPTFYAPLMIPYSVAKCCMQCCEQKFTLLVQRHHCHRCGRIVCAKCSLHKYLLPLQCSKPLRVCNRCFALLKAEGAPLPARQLTNFARLSDSSSCESISEHSGQEEEEEVEDEQEEQRGAAVRTAVNDGGMRFYRTGNENENDNDNDNEDNANGSDEGKARDKEKQSEEMRHEAPQGTFSPPRYRTPRKEFRSVKLA